ncbi:MULTISPECIES: helix-turn-helix domain-containing protein [Streptomyces]|uniref:Transposase family protein n=1 Tax=Streptomyces doudnae TaxID=3075536 RepID=A0ABD5EVF9_9ACTN|nr:MULTISPECIES: transposase family protein [unclassified Streptomyces]MDT0438683.1 transposase family protein [Streptomyces sp. DSM 41981]
MGDATRAVIISNRRITGLTADVIAELVTEIGPLWHERHQARLASRQRRRAVGADAKHRLVFVDRLLPTPVHLRHGTTHDVLACWFGVDRSTITRAIGEVGPLLAERGFTVSPDVRLRSLAEALPRVQPDVRLVTMGQIVARWGMQDAYPTIINSTEQSVYTYFSAAEASDEGNIWILYAVAIFGVLLGVAFIFNIARAADRFYNLVSTYMPPGNATPKTIRFVGGAWIVVSVYILVSGMVSGLQ